MYRCVVSRETWPASPLILSIGTFRAASREPTPSAAGIRQKVEAEVLDAVKGASPGFFEKLVIELLVKMGYGGTMADAGEALERTGDGGIDGVIKEDKLGLDAI